MMCNMTHRDHVEVLTMKMDLLADNIAATEKTTRATGDRKALRLAVEGRIIAQDLVRVIEQKRSSAGLGATYALYDRRLF
jgi:hypothetical protein